VNAHSKREWLTASDNVLDQRLMRLVWGVLAASFTPKALHTSAQGRESSSAPWESDLDDSTNPERVAQFRDRLCNHFRVANRLPRSSPQGALEDERPWAGLCNAFSVEDPRNPIFV
jgi:hypothetical protein